MLNLTNRENLSVTALEQSLNSLSSFILDEDQVALDVLENPKDTVAKLRVLLSTARESMQEMKQQVLNRLLVSLSTLSSMANNNNSNIYHSSNKNNNFGQSSRIMTSTSSSSPQHQQQQYNRQVGGATTTSHNSSRMITPLTISPSGINNYSNYYNIFDLNADFIVPPVAAVSKKNNKEKHDQDDQEENRKNIKHHHHHHHHHHKHRSGSNSNKKKKVTQKKGPPTASFFLPSIDEKVSPQSKKQHHSVHFGDDEDNDSESTSSSSSSYSSDNSEHAHSPSPRTTTKTKSKTSSSSSPLSTRNLQQHQKSNFNVSSSSMSPSPPRHNQNQQNVGRHHRSSSIVSSSGESVTTVYTSPAAPTTYLSVGTHFFLELLARQTLAREVILYRYIPGEKEASVVNVFCCRPQLDLFSDISIGNSLVGRVISSGVAVNISPEFPSETNAPRLVVPIFCSGKRTLVVGAVLLQYRCAGGCFSATEESMVASWATFASHLVQPPALLKGPLINANNNSNSPTKKSHQIIPTSLSVAVERFLPKRGKIFSHVTSTINASNNNTNNNHQTENSSSNSIENQQQQKRKLLDYEHNHKINEHQLFDPFVNEYKHAAWSGISLLETIQKNYKGHFEKIRHDRVQALLREKHQQEKQQELIKLKQHQQQGGNVSLTDLSHSGGKKHFFGAGGESSSSSKKSDNDESTLMPHNAVDRYLNSSIMSSIHDVSTSASDRIRGETSAHKFLMQLCKQLHEEHRKEVLLRSEIENAVNSSSISGSPHHQNLSLATATADILNSGGGGDNNESSSPTGKGQIRTFTSKNSSPSSSPQNKKSHIANQISDSNNNSSTAASASASGGDGLLRPDRLADLVDQVQVPLLVLRTVQQDLWKQHSSVSFSDNNNNTNNVNINDNNNNERLQWFPASSSSVINQNSPQHQQQQGTGGNTSATTSRLFDASSIRQTTSTSNKSDMFASSQQQNPTCNILASGVTESINATISTLPVVDVAQHISKLETSWKNSIEEQRSTDLHHLTHLATLSKTQHKLTVVERQKNEVSRKNQQVTERYNKLKQEIGELCSADFVNSGASSPQQQKRLSLSPRNSSINMNVSPPSTSRRLSTMSSSSISRKNSTARKPSTVSLLGVIEAASEKNNNNNANFPYKK